MASAPTLGMPVLLAFRTGTHASQTAGMPTLTVAKPKITPATVPAVMMVAKPQEPQDQRYYPLSEITGRYL